MTFFLSLVLIVLVIGAAITDLRWHKIPNRLTFPAMAFGIVGHGVMNGIEGIWFSLGGLLLGLVLLIGFYALGGMAAGDVKLLAAVGSFLGSLDVFLVFLSTTLLGGIYALGMMIQELGFIGMFRRLGLIVKTVCVTGNVRIALAGNDQTEMKLRYGLVIALGTLTFQFWYWPGL